MKIFVFVEAYTPTEAYAQIMETQVFTTKEEAVRHLIIRSQEYTQRAEDGELWHVTNEEPMNFHAIYDFQDEVVMNISEHDI